MNHPYFTQQMAASNIVPVKQTVWGDQSHPPIPEEITHLCLALCVPGLHPSLQEQFQIHSPLADLRLKTNITTLKVSGNNSSDFEVARRKSFFQNYFETSPTACMALRKRLFLQTTFDSLLTFTSSTDPSASPVGHPSSTTCFSLSSFLLPHFLYLWWAPFFSQASLLPHRLPRVLTNYFFVSYNKHSCEQEVRVHKPLQCQLCSPAGSWWLCLHPHYSHGGQPCTHLESFQWSQLATNAKNRQREFKLLYNYDRKKEFMWKVSQVQKCAVIDVLLWMHQSQPIVFLVWPGLKKQRCWERHYLFDLLFKVCIICVVDHLGKTNLFCCGLIRQKKLKKKLS